MSAPTPYPGGRLGLPESGAGAMATFGRRLVALLVDWLLCQLIAYAVFGVEWGATGAQSFVPLLVFGVENLLLVSTLGTTIGHRIMGIQVLRIAPGGPGHTATMGGPPGFARGALRTSLLCLAIPAMIWDADGRGLHDKAAGTVIVRSR